MENQELKFDKNRRRVKYCPCGRENKTKFVPYIGYEDKGFCHSCGETFLPQLTPSNYTKKYIYTPPTPISYHEKDLISKCGRNFKENNFVQFLLTLFTKKEVQRAILLYCLGTSKYWQGATIFWQIDDENKIRHGKVMAYNENTGKRSKNNEGRAFISSVRSILKLKDFNLKQCPFGLHLINERENTPIALVEGEKTAIIMSIFKPNYIWLATGSKQGFKHTMLNSIKNHTITAFPDKGEYYEWLDKALELNKIGFNIRVDFWLEKQKLYEKGYDLADVFIEERKQGIIQEFDLKENSPQKENAIITNTERIIYKLGVKNPNVWLLIDEFNLMDKNGHSIKNQPSLQGFQ